MTDIFYIIIGLSILSLLLTNLFRRIAIKRKLFNLPNTRSAHDIPTPRIGGLAIIITWYIGLFILYLMKEIEVDLLYALLCGVLIATVSLIDDIKGVKPIIRFIVQIIASITALYFLGGFRLFFIKGLTFDYSFILYPIIVIGMVWFINLFNFMDGIDGFASNEAISIAFILFLFSESTIPLLLIACVSGFLYWNWPKSKIFMGDVGSTQLGFILIVLGIYFHNSLHFSILNWVMIAAPFWFDASYTLLLRWKNREKLSQAHNKHAYQRIVRAGYSHQKVNFYLIGINLIILTFILIYREISILKLPLTIITILFLYLIYKIVGKKIPFK